MMSFSRCLGLLLLLAAGARAEKKIAVVFSGHPRSFLEASVRRNIKTRALAPLCKEVQCDVFFLVSTTDESLFSGERHRRKGPNVTATEVAELVSDWNVAGIADIENPPPRARRGECNFEQPDAKFGPELANVAMALELVERAGQKYEAVVRMRYDAVWIREPPSILQMMNNSIVVPRHHFPINNHFAVVPMQFATAYFRGPLQLWSKCDPHWRRPQKMLDNPEGLLLRSLLEAKVPVTKIDGLYLTIYRLQDGAECLRLKAYVHGNIAGDCECQFPATDPQKSTPEEKTLVYTFDDVVDAGTGEKVKIAVTEKTYKDRVSSTCAVVPAFRDQCMAHVDALDRAFEVLRRSRRDRNILWDDSFISSAKFADFRIESMDEWNAWIANPNQSVPNQV